MVRISERFRRFLRERCENLIESGVNCFPKWAVGRAPAFKKGERYAKFLVTPINEDEEFKKLVLDRFNDPGVGGIVVVPRVGGLLPIDCDVPKVVNLEREIKALVKEFGHLVYIDRRAAYDGKKARPRGLHAVLYVDKGLFNTHQLLIKHSYNAEFAIKSSTPLTVFPSVRLEKNGKTVEFSAYIKLSSADLFDAVFDERLEVLPRVIEMLGGKLEIVRIDTSMAETKEYTGEPGTPFHGMSLGIGPDEVMLFLRNFVRIIRCEAFEHILDALEKGEPFPIPYFIYSDYVVDCNHPRSSWTLVENFIGRVLGEAGASDDALDKVIEMFEKSEGRYAEVAGAVDHKTVRRNITSSARFREFGHDKAGACLLKLIGLCYKDCHLTPWFKLQSSIAREALERAAAFAKVGRLIEV